MSYYDNQQYPPVGVPPPQGIHLSFNASFFFLQSYVLLSLHTHSAFFIFFILFLVISHSQQGIHQRTLIPHQGTLHNKVTLQQAILLKVTLPKAMLLSTLNNLLLPGKKLVFLKDGMSLFLFLPIMPSRCFFSFVFIKIIEKEHKFHYGLEVELRF